jgi:hypothetical protein
VLPYKVRGSARVTAWLESKQSEPQKKCAKGVGFDSHRPLQSSWFPVTT